MEAEAEAVDGQLEEVEAEVNEKLTDVKRHRRGILTFFKSLKKHEALVQILSFLHQMKATCLGYKMFDAEV